MASRVIWWMWFLFKRPLVKTTVSCHRFGTSYSGCRCERFTFCWSWKCHCYDVAQRPHKLSGVYCFCISLIGWIILIWVEAVHSGRSVRISARSDRYISHKNQKYRQRYGHFFITKMMLNFKYLVWGPFCWRVKTVEPTALFIRFYIDINPSVCINEFLYPPPFFYCKYWFPSII